MSLAQTENDSESGQLISNRVQEDGDVSRAAAAWDWEGTVGLV